MTPSSRVYLAFNHALKQYATVHWTITMMICDKMSLKSKPSHLVTQCLLYARGINNENIKG